MINRVGAARSWGQWKHGLGETRKGLSPPILDLGPWFLGQKASPEGVRIDGIITWSKRTGGSKDMIVRVGT